MALHGDAALGDPKSFYPVLLPGLAKIGLLREGVSEKGDAIWGLEPDALVVTDDVAEVGCTVCSHRMYVAKVEATAFEGVPCLTARCEGHYRLRAQGRPSYFSNLYRAGDLERIFAEEHTGLLEREERERRENAFKASKIGDGKEGESLVSQCPVLHAYVGNGD